MVGSLRAVFRLCETDLFVNEVLGVSSFEEGIPYSAISVIKIFFIGTNTFAPDGIYKYAWLYGIDLLVFVGCSLL